MQHALVTGANRGLGLAFVRLLLERGFQVTACCRHPQMATELADLGATHPERLRLERLDLGNAAAIGALPARLDGAVHGIDLLVNNAGVLVSGERFGSVRAADLGYSFAVNAAAPVLLAQALGEHLRRGHKARVLCISSRIGSITQADAFRTVSYAMSKAALNMAVKRMAAELAPHGIVVLAADPGWLKTRMGGAEATLEPEDSAARLLDLMARATAADNGSFVDRDGNPLPW